MKFTKRMWIAMLAAVLLVAGGLSYFAVAADVEPYYATIPCVREGCDGEATTERHVTNSNTKHIIAGEIECKYSETTYAYTTRCTKGHISVRYNIYQSGHTKCGTPDGYVS